MASTYHKILDYYNMNYKKITIKHSTFSEENTIDLSIIFEQNEFKFIKDIAKTISDYNGNLYLVGGCVRDIILGTSPHDYDFCVEGISAEMFETIFPEAIKQGKSFPVYILNHHEFALARKEAKIGLKHTDFEFLATPEISIYEDLIRRDLTINSMAINIITQELIDPFGGIKDIENKLLKMTSPAFNEDPLRVYRVARFASQLNFNVESETLKMMNSMKNDLINLSVERVFVEFRKALISSNPIIFFKVLRSCNCLDIHFSEISNLIGIEQPFKYHPEGDVYNHTLEVLERVSAITNDELTRFGALVHDFGKAATPKINWPHHYDHDKLGVAIVKNFCHKLKTPNIYLKAGCLASAEHMLAGIYNRLKPGTKIDLFERVYKSKSLSFKGLEIIANSDTKKDSTISFADFAEKVMKEVKFTEEDKLKLKNIKPYKNKKICNKTSANSLNNASPSTKKSSEKELEKIKTILREKRIKYLLKLETNNYPPV